MCSIDCNFLIFILLWVLLLIDEVADKFSSSLLMQEVIRIKNEHPDDNQCIVNDRVKGRLKVTRAFGAGFLKRVLEINF